MMLLPCLSIILTYVLLSTCDGYELTRVGCHDGAQVCYYQLTPPAVNPTWQQANDLCASNGMQLPALGQYDNNRDLKDLLQGYNVTGTYVRTLPYTTGDCIVYNKNSQFIYVQGCQEAEHFFVCSNRTEDDVNLALDWTSANEHCSSMGSYMVPSRSSNIEPYSPHIEQLDGDTVWLNRQGINWRYNQVRRSNPTLKWVPYGPLQSDCVLMGLDPYISSYQTVNCDRPAHQGVNYVCQSGLSHEYVLSVNITINERTTTTRHVPTTTRKVSTTPRQELTTPRYQPTASSHGSTESRLEPTGPSYGSTEPKYETATPRYKPTTPRYEPTTPRYEPTTPRSEPTEPEYGFIGPTGSQDPTASTQEPTSDTSSKQNIGCIEPLLYNPSVCYYKGIDNTLQTWETSMNQCKIQGFAGLITSQLNAPTHWIESLRDMLLDKNITNTYVDISAEEISECVVYSVDGKFVFVDDCEEAEHSFICENKVASDIAMSWSEAVSLCESLGSKLQTFTSTQLVNDTMRFGNNEGSTVWIRKMHDDWLSDDLASLPDEVSTYKRCTLWNVQTNVLEQIACDDVISDTTVVCQTDPTKVISDDDGMIISCGGYSYWILYCIMLGLILLVCPLTCFLCCCYCCRRRSERQEKHLAAAPPSVQPFAEPVKDYELPPAYEDSRTNLEFSVLDKNPAVLKTGFAPGETEDAQLDEIKVAL